MTDAAIEVRGLRKSYGDFEAVRGIEFEVRRGEVFGLLGPNGAGKTTTVEILEGYRQRTGGEVTVLGFDPGAVPGSCARGSESCCRARACIATSACARRLCTLPRCIPHPRDVEEVISLAGLDGKEDSSVRTLSGGQLRRLDLALALVGDPELIFLDEPTTGFDPAARRNAWDAIRSLKSLGKTVLLTTHYLDEAQSLADRVAIIKDGRIIIEGKPQELGANSGATTYRISYRNGDGGLIQRETDDPTTLLHELTGSALAQGRVSRG